MRHIGLRIDSTRNGWTIAIMDGQEALSKYRVSEDPTGGWHLSCLEDTLCAGECVFLALGDGLHETEALHSALAYLYDTVIR